LLKNQVPVTHLVQDLERALIDFKKDDAYSFLYQNIIHAIQANIEGINSLMPLQAAAKDSPIRNWQPFPKLSFKEHINLMHFMVQPFEVDLYEQWLITSLQIEFVMLIAVFLHEKKIPLKLVKINELSFFLITATQQFRAITKKMKQGSEPNAPVTDDVEPFSLVAFLENDQAGMVDESPFNREEMIQKYRIDWTHLPQLQDLFNATAVTNKVCGEVAPPEGGRESPFFQKDFFCKKNRLKKKDSLWCFFSFSNCITIFRNPKSTFRNFSYLCTLIKHPSHNAFIINRF
jgi:hypothetical protein